MCPSQPPGGRGCESLVAWGEGAAQLPRTRGHNAHPSVNACQCDLELMCWGWGGSLRRPRLPEVGTPSHPLNVAQAGLPPYPAKAPSRQPVLAVHSLGY